MSVWQFFAAAEGYRKANSPDTGELSGSESDALWEAVQRKSMH